MKTPKPKLYGRLGKTENYRWVEVEFQAVAPNGPLIPVYPTGIESFILRYTENGKRIVRGVALYEGIEFLRQHGTLPARAPIMQATTAATFEAVPVRKAVNGAVTVAVKISDSLRKFLDELDQAERNGEKSDSTVEVYTNAVTDFRDHCGVTFMHEITREVLLAHKNWLYSNITRKSVGKVSTTVANRFRYLNIWLRRNGIKMAKNYNAAMDDPGLLEWSEVPKPPKKGRNGNAGVDKYSTDEINQLMAAADVDEADLIQFFLRLGVRDEETAFAKWTDIDWQTSTFHVQEKPEFRWKTKDKEDRWIPFNGGLLERLKARQERQTPKSELIFPNSLGKPDGKLIRRLRRVAKRAGYAARPTLHRFRRTFASMMIAKCDLQTVQQLLGHSDIKTTSLYLAPDTEMARKAAATAFEAVGD